MTLVVAVECFGMIEIINTQFIRITENWIRRYVMGGNWKLLLDFLAILEKMIYADNYFDLVVFDPPHLVRAGKTSWLAQKYGVLDGNWKADIKAGFAECFRVLRPFGTLVFKWNTEQIPFSEVIKLAPEQPLFGDKRVNTRWVVFCKGARASDRVTD